MTEILHYDFVWHALATGVLISVLCGVVGTYVVTRRLVFIGGGIAHASLGGVGMGAFFGFSPMLGAMAFALGSAFGIKSLSRFHEVREDSAIALIWTLGMSLGVLFAYLSPGFMPELQSYLFGSILTVTTADLWLMFALTAVVLCLFALFFRPIVSATFDPDFARAQGLPVGLIEWVLLSVVALTIVVSLRLVGIVLVIALLSVPQVTAGLFANRLRSMMALSVAVGLMACLGGLALSYRLNVPSGASIIFTGILIYGLCRAIKKLISVLKIK